LKALPLPLTPLSSPPNHASSAFGRFTPIGGRSRPFYNFDPISRAQHQRTLIPKGLPCADFQFF
jgi:hypothetical protein